MATSIPSASLSSFAVPRTSIGGNHLLACQIGSLKSPSYVKIPISTMRKNSSHWGANHKLCVRAEHNDNRSGSGGDLLAGFLLGGAIFGTLAYVYAPQIRRSILNEDEYGFRKTKRPIYYYDDGLEKTRETLNEKIRQLNSAIDNVSSRLRGGGGNNMPPVPVEIDPEEASI